MKKSFIKNLSNEGRAKKPGAASVCGIIYFLVIIIAGCTGPLQIKYNPPQGSSALKLKEPVSVLVGEFKDSRQDAGVKGPRTIGRIESTVADMDGGKLTLSQDIGDVVANAFKQELSMAGYAVRSEGETAQADYVLIGEVKDFSLDIGARDRISIELSTRITERETGKAVWSGTQGEKGDRYAGVMGNSRSTISNYISASLSKVIRSTISEAAGNIAKMKTSSPPAYQASPVIKTPEGSGRVMISTEPPRSKVYLNDIYFGLTPLSVDIDPGVYGLTVRKGGFKDNKEKVSVRPGQVTEMEMTLEKE